VRGSCAEVQRIVESQGLIARREHPELSGAIAWLKRNGQLVPVLPGVYTVPARINLIDTRIKAVGWWDRDAVLTDAAAARVSYWPDIEVPVIVCAVRHERTPQPGYAFVRRVVPPELIIERRRLRYTRPALTALDLCVETNGGSIDQVLRTRTATLDHLHEVMALTPARVGNRERRRLLLESRARPWSAAERSLHRLLWRAEITGWDGNRPVVIDGTKCYPDVLFEKCRLIIEIDGRAFHSDREVFESDRQRQNLFVINGWCVLRFTVRMIEDEPEMVIATIRAALAMLASQ
jgi:very-short-patch-repair endonuclease